MRSRSSFVASTSICSSASSRTVRIAAQCHCSERHRQLAGRASAPVPADLRSRSGPILAGVLLAGAAAAQGLTPVSLGVVYDLDDANSGAIARYYAAKRGIPTENLLGVHAVH